MSRVRVSVVKIGGSLLDAADLPQRLRTWIATEQAARDDSHFVFIAGGGKLVDAVRCVDAKTPLGDERAHWICIELLDITARLVHAMLPEHTLVRDFAQLEDRQRARGVTFFSPQQFLREIEPTHGGTRLVADWSVTSDSIATRLAIVLAADEVVLLKSAPPPMPSEGNDSLAQLAATGFVDAFLPRLAQEIAWVRVTSL